jgi:tRNA(fMet)-specific endonuclease VapC
MPFLLDTNIVSDLIRHPQGHAARRARAAADALCLSVIVAAELRYGCAKKGSARLTERVEAVLAEIPVLPWAQPADAAYGMLRTGLEAEGRLIGGNDLLIAAHALALDATLVTANKGDFSRIRGLLVEDWLG